MSIIWSETFYFNSGKFLVFRLTNRWNSIRSGIERKNNSVFSSECRWACCYRVSVNWLGHGILSKMPQQILNRMHCHCSNIRVELCILSMNSVPEGKALRSVVAVPFFSFFFGHAPFFFHQPLKLLPDICCQFLCAFRRESLCITWNEVLWYISMNYIVLLIFMMTKPLVLSKTWIKKTFRVYHSI